MNFDFLTNMEEPITLVDNRKNSDNNTSNNTTNNNNNNERNRNHRNRKQRENKTPKNETYSNHFSNNTNSSSNNSINKSPHSPPIESPISENSVSPRMLNSHMRQATLVPNKLLLSKVKQITEMITILEKKKQPKHEIINILKRTKEFDDRAINFAYEQWYESQNMYVLQFDKRPLGFSVVMDSSGNNAIISRIQNEENRKKGLKFRSQIYSINDKVVEGNKHKSILKTIVKSAMPLKVVFRLLDWESSEWIRAVRTPKGVTSCKIGILDRSKFLFYESGYHKLRKSTYVFDGSKIRERQESYISPRIDHCTNYLGLQEYFIHSDIFNINDRYCVLAGELDKNNRKKEISSIIIYYNIKKLSNEKHELQLIMEPETVGYLDFEHNWFEEGMRTCLTTHSSSTTKDVILITGGGENNGKDLCIINTHNEYYWKISSVLPYDFSYHGFVNKRDKNGNDIFNKFILFQDDIIIEMTITIIEDNISEWEPECISVSFKKLKSIDISLGLTSNTSFSQGWKSFGYILVKNVIIIFGGTLNHNVLANNEYIYKYNITQNEWTKSSLKLSTNVVNCRALLRLDQDYHWLIHLIGGQRDNNKKTPHHFVLDLGNSYYYKKSIWNLFNNTLRFKLKFPGKVLRILYQFVIKDGIEEFKFLTLKPWNKEF